MNVRRLGASDAQAMRELNALFSSAFDDPASYPAHEPGDAYLQRVLGNDAVIVLVAAEAGQIVGGLVAYVLPKLEQERSEIYIYDLAVDEAFRRRGVATGLIDELKGIAAEIGGWVIYVQADYGDDPAIALYNRLGTREDVMHFDIAPGSR
jgi:aminoglycoside 3-N-acetyltransferase I